MRIADNKSNINKGNTKNNFSFCFRRCIEDMRSRESHFHLTVERAQNTSSMLAEQAGLFSKHPASPNVPPHLSSKPAISLLPSRLPQPAHQTPPHQTPRSGPPTPPRRTVSRTPPRRSASSTASQYSSLSPSPSFSSQDSDPMSRQIRDAQMRQSRALRPALPPKAKNFGYNATRMRKGSRGSEVSESSEISLQSLRSERSLDHRYIDQEYPVFRDDRVDMFRKRNSQSIESSSERNSADLSDHGPVVADNGYPPRPSNIRITSPTFNTRQDTTFPVRTNSPQHPVPLQSLQQAVIKSRNNQRPLSAEYNQNSQNNQQPRPLSAEYNQNSQNNQQPRPLSAEYNHNKQYPRQQQVEPRSVHFSQKVETNRPPSAGNRNETPPPLLSPRSPPSQGVNPNDITRALESLLSPKQNCSSSISSAHSELDTKTGPDLPSRVVSEHPPRHATQPRNIPQSPVRINSQPEEDVYMEMTSPASVLSPSAPRRSDSDMLVLCSCFLT